MRPGPGSVIAYAGFISPRERRRGIGRGNADKGSTPATVQVTPFTPGLPRPVEGPLYRAGSGSAPASGDPRLLPASEHRSRYTGEQSVRPQQCSAGDEDLLSARLLTTRSPRGT